MLEDGYSFCISTLSGATYLKEWNAVMEKIGKLNRFNLSTTISYAGLLRCENR
jgi:hypothetical protein